MSDRATYTAALEKRLEWYRWAQRDGKRMYAEGANPHMNGTARTLHNYERGLADGPTYFMNRRFCELVDLARQSVPDNLAFDPTWLVTRTGWMLLEVPFSVPAMAIPAKDHPYVTDAEGKTLELEPSFGCAAIAWYSFSRGDNGVSLVPPLSMTSLSAIRKRIDALKDGETAVYFMCYLDRRLIDPRWSGFGMWSHFTICPGDPVGQRIHEFESYASTMQEGAYVDGRASELKHEIRWIYSAFHLMSQKLAMTKAEPAQRATRRRMEREQLPHDPLVRLVTLRRLEEARASDHQSQHVDWKWQWKVAGFWRNQFFPSTGEHKPVWIDDYIKGPADKPFKAAGATIYKAVR